MNDLLRRSCVALLLAVLTACSSTGLPAGRTGLAVFDHPPREADRLAVEGSGATEAFIVEALSGIAFRTAGSLESLSEVPGVRNVYNLGPEDEPLVDVFVVFVSEISESDVEQVRTDFGAITSGPVSIQPDVLPAQVPIRHIDALMGWERIADIELGNVGSPG